MKTFENCKFYDLHNYDLQDSGGGWIFSDMEFVDCQFIGCTFSTFEKSLFNEQEFVRTVAQNLRFVNCTIDGVHIGPGIVEDTTIDGLKLRKHMQTWGTVFKHVVIKGVVDKLMLTPYVDVLGNFPHVQRYFDRANSEYYEDVDWALDISEASFKDCDIRAIPARLIRRDPSTQVVLTREKAMQGKWRELDLSGTFWPTAIELFLESGYKDELLVAPKKARNFRQLLEGLNKLRDAGVVEPD